MVTQPTSSIPKFGSFTAALRAGWHRIVDVAGEFPIDARAWPAPQDPLPLVAPITAACQFSIAMFAGLLALSMAFCAPAAANATPDPAQPPKESTRVSAAGAAVHSVTADQFLRSLTDQERAWLRQHPVIRVAQDPSSPPVQFVDEHGVPSGMTKDYLQLIEQRLGLKFEWVPNLSWQEAYAGMTRWEIDMTPSVAMTSERTAFWAFTKTYMSIPIVIVSPADVTYIGDPRELEGNKVAVVASHASETWLKRDFPKIQLVPVTTTEECLATVQRGDVSACVENMLVVGYYLSMLKMTDLKVSGSTNYINAQRMAVRKDWATLAVILDKALDSISAADRETIYRRWLPVRHDDEFNYTRLWQIAVVFALVLIALAVWNAHLKREIRQRALAGSAAAKSLKRLTEAQRIGQIGDWELDLATGKISWSPQVFEILGRDPQLGPPRDIGEAAAQYDAVSRTLLEEKVARAIKSGEPQEYELLVLRPDGKRVPVLLRAVPIKDAGGTVTGLYGTVQDITERKRAEEHVQRMNAELEGRVLERTADLTSANDRLQAYSTTVSEALRVAETADRAKLAFLATVSHELRTPLNSILGFTDVILAGLPGPLNSEQTKQLCIVQGSARHLLSLINDVLDISTIEAGKVQINVEPFDLRAAVERVTASIKPLADQKRLSLTAVVSQELGDIVSDRRRVEQILLNLLGNAVKFTDRGSVTLTVDKVLGLQTDPDVAPSPAVRFRVADTGIGIRPEELVGLFDAFRQAESGRTSAGEGTGLGLAICSRLAPLLGGEIFAVSERAKGSTFTLVLPLVERAELAVELPASPHRVYS